MDPAPDAAAELRALRPPGADGVAGLEVAQESPLIEDRVVLDAQPEHAGRGRPGALGRDDERLDAIRRDPVVREVHLPDGRAPLEEVSQQACAIVADLVPEEFQNLQTSTSMAQVMDRLQPYVCELILRKVNLAVRIAIVRPVKLKHVLIPKSSPFAVQDMPELISVQLDFQVATFLSDGLA